MTYEYIKAQTPVWQAISEAGEPVCLYGTGNAAERILGIFSEKGIECSGIFASSGFVRDREFCGYKVRSLEELEDELGGFTAVCAFGSQLADVMQNIDRISERHRLLMPDLPIAGDEFFTRKSLLDRYESYCRIRKLLADEHSRALLDSVLCCKLTGRLEHLRGIFTEPIDDVKKLISPRKGDIYADLGAYNGDTCEQFAGLCPEYSRIYAFEPDMRSFRKCVRRLESLDAVTLVNACAWSHDTDLYFSQSAGRQSQISDSGTVTAARSLDSVLNGNDCTVIKYDVEGAESRALQGSSETIRRCRPRLAISAYHRPYDLFDLIEQLMEIRSDYSLYLRQPPYYPAWDTMIYAI